MKAARTRALNRKHAGTGKHGGTGKHTPAAQGRSASAHGQRARRVAKGTKAAHLRALSPGAACCPAEALAASLRLSGWPVSPADVLALYRHTAGSPGAGATIVASLEAAYRFGLAGVRPVEFAQAGLDDPAAVLLGLDMPEGRHAVTLDLSGAVWSWGALYDLTGEAVIEEAWAVTWP